MKLSIPQIPIEKRGRVENKNYVYYNFFNSPKYGGLHLKHWDYNERHIFMNELLKDIYILYSVTVKEHVHIGTYSYQHAHYRILFMIESFVYWLRKNIDEMIGFNYYSYYFMKHGIEPKKLDVSSIGELKDSKDSEFNSIFREHSLKLNQINEISNTFKHSFINNEAHNLMGKDEPVINCLDMHRNNTVKEPKWRSYFLREIVEDYVSFFVLSRETLKQFTLPGKPQ